MKSPVFTDPGLYDPHKTGGIPPVHSHVLRHFLGMSPHVPGGQRDPKVTARPQAGRVALRYALARSPATLPPHVDGLASVAIPQYRNLVLPNYRVAAVPHYRALRREAEYGARSQPRWPQPGEPPVITVIGNYRRRYEDSYYEH